MLLGHNKGTFPVIIPAWVAISVLVFASGNSKIYTSEEIFKTKEQCEAVQVKVMEIVADEPEILAVGTYCAEVKVNNEFPRNEKPKKNLPKQGV